MNMTRLCHAGLVVLTASLVGCTGTKIIESTVLEDTGPVDLSGKTVAVLALTGDEAVRKAVENALVLEFGKRDIQGLASHTVIPSESARDQDQVKTALAASEADLLIVLDLLGTKEETRYEVADPFDHYYHSTFYYSYSALYDHRYIHDPFVWERTYTTYTVATLVYRMSDEKLVWKAISESFAPAGAKGFAREITRAASATLKKEGLLK